MLKKSEVEPRHYRDAMSRFAGAVHVVSTDGSAGRRGTTVIAACSVSDEPPTVLVCLNRGNEANDLYVKNGVFALNTLAAGQQDLANAFSGLTGHCRQTWPSSYDDHASASVVQPRRSTARALLKGPL